MAHILTWKTQLTGTKSWRLTINEQRRQIAELRQDNPRFTEEYIRARWPRYLRVALAKAADEMDQPAAGDTLPLSLTFNATNVLTNGVTTNLAAVLSSTVSSLSHTKSSYTVTVGGAGYPNLAVNSSATITWNGVGNHPVGGFVKIVGMTPQEQSGSGMPISAPLTTGLYRPFPRYLATRSGWMKA